MTIDETTTGESPEYQAAQTATSGFRSVWRHRRWRWMLGSVVVSLAGDFLYVVALAVFLTKGSDPEFWLAISLLARLLPYTLVGPIGGAIADRVNRRRLLVVL